jgi:hypothetical protein
MEGSMSKLPVKPTRTEVREAEDAYELLEPEQRSPAAPFFSFSFSHTEVSLQGGRTRVKSRSARFADGKLETQNFEGELDRSAYDQWIDQTQRAFAQQASLLLQPLSWFLPFAGRRRSDRD